MLNLNQELNRHILSDVLCCPLCRAGMMVSSDGHSLMCTGSRTHCFDGGGSGYLPLSPRHPGGGDSKEAVRARTEFLNHGYYAPAADALCELLTSYVPTGSVILDAGCGEGYYSNHMAAVGYDVLGVDLSKFAVDAAARAARRLRIGTAEPSVRTVYAVGSVFDLPVRSASVDCVTNIFAPCAPEEYARVLKPGGYLVVAGAGPTHLIGLKQRIYDDPYLNDPRRDLPEETHPFDPPVRHTVTFTTTIQGRADVAALFTMTPYYWRTDREGRERLLETDRLETEVFFDFFVYRRGSSGIN